MKNKKGFTLVELLAVVAILGTIATVATFSTMSIIESQKEELLKEQIANLKDAAQSYYIKSKRYLSVCPSSLSPETLINQSEEDLDCAMKIKVGELTSKKFFENKNNVCDEEKYVLVYKKSKQDTSIYVAEGVCEN